MTYTAAYLTGQVAGRELGGGDFVLESSRRARGFATWAALRSLGAVGVAELVDRCCVLARRFADAPRRARRHRGRATTSSSTRCSCGVGDDDLTDRRRATRPATTAPAGSARRPGAASGSCAISVSNWSTTEADVDLVVETLARLRAGLVGASGCTRRRAGASSRSTSSTSSRCRSSSRRRKSITSSRYLLRWGRRLGARVGLVEPLAEVGDVVAERRRGSRGSPPRRRGRDQQAEERLALERREARPGCGAYVAQRLEPLVGERVDGPLAGLARLLARLEVAEPGEPLRLDVVLALAGPVEHPAAPRHAQQVVGAGARPADEAEDLVGEEGQLVA